MTAVAEEVDADVMDDDEAPGSVALWEGDLGTLQEQSRRALLTLLKGPYLSGRDNPRLWTALVADTKAIRSRLNDLFLDLVIDPLEEFAYTVRPERVESGAPNALRTEKMSFIDTAMLLVLRQLTLTSDTGERLIVGKDEVYDALSIYRAGDQVTFRGNLNAAWGRMHAKYRLLHKVEDDRSEVSPMVRYLVDEDRVKSLMETYAGLTQDNTAEEGGVGDD